MHPLPLDGSVFPADLWSLGECVAPTLYETGDDLVDWAEAALDLVGDGPITVIGCSIGGSCAIEVALLAPAKVQGLVLCGTKPAHRPDPAFRDEALRVIDEEGLRAAWDRYWLPLFGPHASAEVTDQAWRTAARQGPGAIAAGVRAFHSRPDRAAFVGAWTGPVVVASGEHDIDPPAGRQLAHDLPEGRFRPIPDVGHYLPLEAPSAMTTLVTELLDAAQV